MRAAAFPLAVLLATSLVPAAALAQTDHSGHGAHASHDAANGASQAYMAAMDRMNASMDGTEMTGKPGVDFALMMIPHHRSAIDMARAYLDSDEKDPELVKLSEEIIAAQEREITYLEGFLEKNGVKAE